MLHRFRGHHSSLPTPFEAQKILRREFVVRKEPFYVAHTFGLDRQCSTRSVLGSDQFHWAVIGFSDCFIWVFEILFPEPDTNVSGINTKI